MATTLTRIAILIAFIGTLGAWTRSKAAGAGPRSPIVLELFTSEGCSSCPPADRLLQSLEEEQPIGGARLIVLSEHVDYWNSGGWADPYSSKLFSERQGWYAEQFGLDGVYTPQVVVNGQRETVGSNAAAIRKAVEAALGSQNISLTLSRAVHAGNQLTFHLSSADLPASAGSATVYIALAQNRARSSVTRGENGGRSLTHVAVVRALSPAGTVKGGSSFSKNITIPVPSAIASERYHIVAFLQDTKSHKILGAASEEPSS